MAGSGITMEIHGLTELEASCTKAAVALPAATRLMDTEAAGLVATRARSIVPRRTGRLASTIHITQSGEGAMAEAGPLVYAPLVHFGSIHNPRPVPFMYDAADQADGAITALYARDVDTLIHRAF